MTLSILILSFVSSISFAQELPFGESSSQIAESPECQMVRDQISRIPVSNQVDVAIRLPAGHFICSRPIVIDRNHISLLGDVSGATFIKLAPHANSPVIIIGETTRDPKYTVEHIRVADLSVDGNQANQDYECWGFEDCDVDTDTPDARNGGHPIHSSIRNNGITVRGAHHIDVHNVVLNGNRSGGMVTEHDVDDLMVTNLTAKHNYYDGFACYQMQNATIRNAHLSENIHGSGISIDINCNHNLFIGDLSPKPDVNGCKSDFKIESNIDNGLFIRDSEGNRFQNICIEGNRNFGVFMAFVDRPETCVQDTSFDGVDIGNSGQTAIKFVGAITQTVDSDGHTHSWCSGNTVTNSVFHGNGGLGDIVDGEFAKIETVFPVSASARSY